MKFRYIPIELIYKKDNIREETETELADLAESIDQFDLIQPILVRPVGERFEIISGHRRYLACKMRGEPSIPCVVRNDISESDRIYLQLVENTQRKQMSAIELVDTFDRLKEQHPGLTNARIAVRMGRSVQWVSNQYFAAKIAEQLGNVEDVKKMTAGQIVGRAQKQGVFGAFKRNSKVNISFKGRTIKIVCNGIDVRDEVLKMLDASFPDTEKAI